MSLILPSTVSPLPTANASASATARQGDSAQNESASFGETLARSLEPARQAADQSAAPDAAPPKKGPTADDKKPDADALVNLLVLALPPRVPGTAKGMVSGNTAAPAALSAQAGGTAATEVLAAEAGAATRLTQTLERPTATDASEAADATEGLNLLAVASVTGHKESGQAAASTRLAAADETPALQTAATAAGASAADSRSSAPQPQHDQAKQPALGEITQAEAGLAPGALKPSASDVVLAPALAPISHTAAPDAGVLANGTLSVPPVGAGLQPAGTAAAATAPLPPATLHLTPEVGHGAWGKALGQQVIHLGTTGQHQAELQLNPPGLGPLKVSLSMNEQHMQALFVSAHASVRAAVEAALPQLRHTLAESGISLGDTSVSAESQPQTSFAEQQEREPARFSREDGASAGANRPERPVTEAVRMRSGTGVDTYA